MELLVLLLCVLSAESITTQLPSLHDRIYHSIDTFYPCFRLINATRQIGCSGSATSKSGVVHYVANNTQLQWLVKSGVHPPYIALLESAMFTSDNVLLLKSSSKVQGIIVKYNTSGQLPDLGYFSPESSSPNCGFGIETGSCDAWNANGTGLSRMDFGDFPISAITTDGFDYLYNTVSFCIIYTMDVVKPLLSATVCVSSWISLSLFIFKVTCLLHYMTAVVHCYLPHNSHALHGTSDEYPLCAAEMVADMFAVTNTETCFRRNSLPIFYLNDQVMCEPLGDNNVWSSLFDLPQKPKDIIMIATKLDSTAFFPYLSFGANNEVAGIATLMGVAGALGQLKKESSLVGTKRPVLFALFHGKLGLYIGSSRMVYDMVNGVFPYKKDNSKQQPPMFNVSDITDFLELSHVGMPRGNNQYTYFIHPSSSNANSSDLMSALKEFGSTSLQRFLKVNRSLNGIIISDYDTQYNNRFFGSRFDNLQNLVGADGLSENSSVVQALTSLATLIANAVFNISQPNATSVSNISANSTLIKNVLECFLKNSSCTLFQTILHPQLAATLQPIPLSRYVTVATVSNPETKLSFQLLSYLTGIINSNTTCSACLLSFNSSIQSYNVTWMQGTNYNTSLDNCWCVKSYTHYHMAKSPAFELKQYSSSEYSTWAESSWKTITLRVYLVTSSYLEIGLLVCGLAMTATALGLGVCVT
ncbi:hypothetical protein EMCRGX_G011264 [Ephydatia muelleri]